MIFSYHFCILFFCLRNGWRHALFPYLVPRERGFGESYCPSRLRGRSATGGHCAYGRWGAGQIIHPRTNSHSPPPSPMMNEWIEWFDKSLDFVLFLFGNFIYLYWFLDFKYSPTPSILCKYVRFITSVYLHFIKLILYFLVYLFISKQRSDDNQRGRSEEILGWNSPKICGVEQGIQEVSTIFR